jgi:[FeFe] hydrogenase H-cluster maturation GTPase HydF
MKRAKDHKPHLAIFGKRNVGKSSLINYLSGQETSIVSDKAGTTTDPVKKSIEIFGIGPAIIVDTAGIDDVGELGSKRVEKSLKTIDLIDLGIVVFSGDNFDDFEINLIASLKQRGIPFIVIHNKSDLNSMDSQLSSRIYDEYGVEVFSMTTSKPDFKEDLISLLKNNVPENAYLAPNLFEGIIEPKSKILLVTPIDSEAPEGRMILPQMMAVRHSLDKDSTCILVKETELEDAMNWGMKFDLVVTDSQAFEFVSALVPEDVPLTSFSILFARLKGEFDLFLEGTSKLSNLKDGDTVLMLESCTHQVSCDDIGRFKLPKWIKEYTGLDLNFEFVSGFDQIKLRPNDYSIVIQCGGCVVTSRQMKSRMMPFANSGIPVTNYGMAIAYLNGIFKRSVEVFV